MIQVDPLDPVDAVAITQSQLGSTGSTESTGTPCSTRSTGTTDLPAPCADALDNYTEGCQQDIEQSLGFIWMLFA